MPPGTFSVISRSGPDSVGGGGVVAEIFSVAASGDQSNSLNYGSLFYISGGPGHHPSYLDTHGNSGKIGRSAYTFKERNNINSFQKKNIYQKLGGAWHPWPPGYATAAVTIKPARKQVPCNTLQ